MAGLFGTDGVRGIANTELDSSLAYKLGQAAVKFLGKKVVIGKDTRLSGDMLEAAVAAGIMSMGGTALTAGIIPTPAIALLTREREADGGIVISASHNPPEYNGIKFFDRNGFKLSEEEEKQVEDFVTDGGAAADEMPDGIGVGRMESLTDALDIYIDHIVDSVTSQGISFKGMKIALDVGHGASLYTSPEALRRLGATVFDIHSDYNGTDINVDCGSTHLEPLKRLVEETQADVGIAHDGDADRVMMIDTSGRVIDGDTIEAVCALDLKNRNCLTGNTVVSTVMCNLGFIHAMREKGIDVLQTQVGDRHVLEAMQEKGLIIGGEQSGHVILLEYNSTGDGLLVACQFLAACKRQGATIDEAASLFEPYPQVLINVSNVNKEALHDSDSIERAIKEAEEELGDNGRVLIRPSGTEPLVRVMVEASEESTASDLAHKLADLIKQELSQ